MNKQAADILQAFGEWLNYDRSQKSFTVSSYDLHRCGEEIDLIQSKIDPSGTFSCLFAKSFFIQSCKNTKVSVYDVFENPDIFNKTAELWDKFHSANLYDIKKTFHEKIINTCLKYVEDDAYALPDLENANEFPIEDIVYESLTRFQSMNIDILKPADTVEWLHCDKYYINIETYDTMGECLLMNINHQLDNSVKLVYITNHNTNDGYFSYILKSNNGIISVNDRVDEAFRGQHAGGRNQRYTDNYNYNLFPYDILDYSDERDYKGYSTGKSVNYDTLKDKLKDFDFLYRHVLRLVCMSNVPTCITADKPPVFCSSILPKNLYKLQLTAGSNALIDETYSNYLPEMYREEFDGNSLGTIYQSGGISLLNEYGRLLNVRDEEDEKPWRTFGYFEPSIDNTDILELFQPDNFEISDNIEDVVNTKFLPDHSVMIEPEVVGSLRYLSVISYHSAREQLATAILKNMFTEFIQSDFNCTRWFCRELEKQDMKELRLKLLECMHKAENKFEYGVDVSVDESYEKSCYAPFQPGSYCETYIDDETDTKCNVWITCNVTCEKGFHTLFGDIELPKWFKGYTLATRGVSGNSLLHPHDSCAYIGNINENKMKRKLEKYMDDNGYRYNEVSEVISRLGGFLFCIGMSKRTYNKISRIVNTCIDNKHTDD